MSKIKPEPLGRTTPWQLVCGTAAPWAIQRHHFSSLGHAFYMKAIQGGKANSDKIDSHTTAVLLRRLRRSRHPQHHIGRSVCSMLKNQEACDMTRFFA